jgi:acyl-coenzyme A thioesterase PaaI-like protein
VRAPSARLVRLALNLYPPLLFAGVRVLSIGDDWRTARVVLRRTWYNRNYVGVHFGGSLFAMTDPFWMIMTLRCLGPGYVVWDQAATIDFVAPGRGDVFAEFAVTDAMLDELRAATAHGDKALVWRDVEVKSAEGAVIARVRKQLYVRRKRPIG